MPKIALAQFESKLCDPPANVVKAIPMIRQAGLDGSDMIMFPEMFTTGYELSIVGPRITELAEPVERPDHYRIARGRRTGRCVCGGSPSRSITMTCRVCRSIAPCLLDREGNVAGVYDKQHLWALERFYFRAATDTPVFQTDFGTIGIMICYDMGYPEVARMLALQGARIVLCPSAWCEPDHDVWDINVPARALENTVFLCAVNRYGREQDLYMGGHSKVCDPRGRVVAELPDEGEGVLNVEIDLADVVSNRQTSPYLRDRRPELYGKVLLP